MKTLYETPLYRLEGDVLKSPGVTTVELYQTFTEARHPRQQRICQLNLPPEAVCRIGAWLIQNSGH